MGVRITVRKIRKSQLLSGSGGRYMPMIILKCEHEGEDKKSRVITRVFEGYADITHVMTLTRLLVKFEIYGLRQICSIIQLGRVLRHVGVMDNIYAD